jgi:hypothetical protein
VYEKFTFALGAAASRFQAVQRGATLAVLDRHLRETLHT